MWSMIFGYVPQSDLMSQRLVNKKWCNNIDTLAGLHVSFKDDLQEDALEFFCKRRVRCFAYSCLHQDLVPKLSNPNMLKKIEFAPSSSSNVKNILSAFVNIESLAFYTLLSLDKFFEVDYDYSNILGQLKNLQEIDIGIHSISQWSNANKSSIFETIVGNGVIFPLLKKVRFSCNFFRSIQWKQLFKWLGYHSKTLESLELSFALEQDITEDDLKEVDMKLLLSLNLRHMRIVSDSARNSSVHMICEQLLSAQKSLESLYTSLSGLTSNTYFSAMQNSASSLRSVKFYHVFLTERVVPLDELLFVNNCVTDLVFHCNPSVVFVPFDLDGYRHYHPTIQGWAVLPRSLKRVHIQGCSIPTEDFVSLCDSLISNSVCNLQELVLIYVGDAIGFGLTIPVFYKICSLMPDLKVFKLSPINGTADGEANTAEDEERVRVWKKIVDTAKNQGIYEIKIEDRDVTHVFHFDNAEKKKLFVEKMDAILNETETN